MVGPGFPAVLVAALGGDEQAFAVLWLARIVGKRPGTVRVLAHRGLRRLAKQMEGAGLLGGVTQ